ncbi:helix-turn-helix domain-containing protein [Pantoea sp. 1.19]|uniref:helix-turn-helix domain-containing protein n=1 Tax=Pantoea sp. 1.19 TaxID=1925589 RepID=UPI000948A0EA|nr:helix-turn-helix domain-containing protein [Pantoea sp. 1.19]
MFSHQVINDLILWIASHRDSRLSVDDCARKAGYSKWYLQRLFRDVTGRSLAAYCREQRLHAAADMLRQPDVTVQQVALQHGFDSQVTFHKTFKKHYGLTPGEFRRRA